MIVAAGRLQAYIYVMGTVVAIVRFEIDVVDGTAATGEAHFKRGSSFALAVSTLLSILLRPSCCACCSVLQTRCSVRCR